MYNDLFQILLNFRLFPVGLSSDICKMFLQINVAEKDWQYQKMLWRFSPQDPLEIYLLTVVIFGLKSSPFLAQRVIKQLVCDEGHRHPTASKILNSLFMDDCVMSFLTVSEAQIFYQEVAELFKAGGFLFSKWISNSTEVLGNIPVSEQLPQLMWFDNSSSSDQKVRVKILGMGWDASSDCFTFKTTPCSKPDTKRGILSYILTIYDPMGLLAPVVLWAKLLGRPYEFI